VKPVAIRIVGRTDDTSGIHDRVHFARGIGRTESTSGSPAFVMAAAPARRPALWSTPLTESPKVVAVARDFYCERTPSKTRVSALLTRPGAPSSLHPILTCRDPLQAQAVADLLTLAARRGTTPALNDRVAQLLAVMPDAPAASFKDALAKAAAGAWPVDPQFLPQWPEQTDEDVEATADAIGAMSHTSSDARLADLAGPVVRIFRLHEFHVHDVPKLLAAAQADDWEPMPAEELDQDDLQDVVGAVMHLADAGIDIPGADWVTEASSGELLSTAQGDEVADWSRTRVVADFGTGWLAARPRPDVVAATAHVEAPDFAALFPEPDHRCEGGVEDCEECGWDLTPRTADILHTALSCLADEAYSHAEELEERPVTGEDCGAMGVFGRLPRITWREDADWRRQFARACDDLAGDLVAGRWPEPTCTAEEMALHLAIAEAPGYADLAEDDVQSPHHGLPERDDDYDWDACADLLFQDTDVLLLFDASLDGIEDPDGEINQTLDMTSLQAKEWFEPFGNTTHRDTERGFRR
jgi:hypothetical protein